MDIPEWTVVVCSASSLDSPSTGSALNTVSTNVTGVDPGFDSGDNRK